MDTTSCDKQFKNNRLKTGYPTGIEMGTQVPTWKLHCNYRHCYIVPCYLGV